MPDSEKNPFMTKLLKISLLFSLILLISCPGCKSGPTGAEEAKLEIQKRKVEDSIARLAAEFKKGLIPPQKAEKELKKFIEKNAAVYSAYAIYPPGEKSGKPTPYSVCVYRSGKRLFTKISTTPAACESPWYQRVTKLGRPDWSDSYFDQYGSGRDVIIYAFPVYTNGPDTPFLGVVTGSIKISK